jgi:hypothetical protein
MKGSKYSGFVSRDSCDWCPDLKRSLLGKMPDVTGDRNILRILVMLCLMAALLLEGYYILELRHRTEDQEEDLRIFSMQLQSLKNERDSLHEELSLIKKGGEKKNENTSQREH